jgi:PIN domain nuclease of toxin-antitoxin system
VNAIIDTHVFLWAALDDDRLSERARGILVDTHNKLFLSAASANEIAVKARKGRLTLPEPPETYVPTRLAALAFEPLSIDVVHGIRAAGLPMIHGDPWDRMLIAQAQHGGWPILTADPAISRYDVETIW